METGFYFLVRADQQSNGNVFAAAITGPGLPDTGYWIFWRDFGYDRYYRFQADTTTVQIPENAVYTITLFDPLGKQLAEYTQTVPRRPALLAELSGVGFPLVSAGTVTSLNDFSLTEMDVAWEMGAGIKADSVTLVQTDGMGNASGDGRTLDGTVARTSLKAANVTDAGVSFSPAARILYVSARDLSGRWFQTCVDTLPRQGAAR